jgi:hypothetical protein
MKGRMDRNVEPTGARLVSKLFAAMSVASGVALALAPDRMADVYAFPRHRPRLVRALGVRDVVIGVLLLRTGTERMGYRSRAAADAMDVALMLREVASGRRRARHPRLAQTPAAHPRERRLIAPPPSSDARIREL